MTVDAAAAADAEAPCRAGYVEASNLCAVLVEASTYYGTLAQSRDKCLVSLDGTVMEARTFQFVCMAEAAATPTPAP